MDRRGPRIPLIGAFILLLTGYSGVKLFFDAGLPEGVATMTTFNFCLLVFCSFMTGAGGNGGLTSSVNSTAKTFPDKTVRAHLDTCVTMTLIGQMWLTARNGDRVRYRRIWIVSVYFFNDCARHVRGEYISIPANSSTWHGTTHDRWLLPRQTNPTPIGNISWS